MWACNKSCAVCRHNTDRETGILVPLNAAMLACVDMLLPGLGENTQKKFLLALTQPDGKTACHFLPCVHDEGGRQGGREGAR